MLHITNGDATVDGFVAGSIPGSYLPWRDPLHDGAVPHAPSLEALSDIRARVLSEFGWGSFESIRGDFAARDRTLAGFRDHDETVLWFEHDLYDQLQLIQLLDWFSQQDLTDVRLSLIQLGEHPDVPEFHGLGELTGPQLAALMPRRAPVTPNQLEVGRRAWRAFCAPDPRDLAVTARRHEPELPFLADAIGRFLEEYPSVRAGLSRTERQLLAAGAAGAQHRREYYVQSGEFEACPWGDGSVYLRLDALGAGDRPALDRVGADRFALNAHGRRLLAGEDDWVRSRNGVDMWLGGVHLSGSDAEWRWSEDDLTFRRTMPA